MSRLASRSPAAPFQSSRPAPVTPRLQQRKDAQDAARRQQQADERVRELEKEIDRLRYALQKIKDLPPVDEIHAIAADALDGGGDTNE